MFQTTSQISECQGMDQQEIQGPWFWCIVSKAHGPPLAVSADWVGGLSTKSGWWFQPLRCQGVTNHHQTCAAKGLIEPLFFGGGWYLLGGNPRTSGDSKKPKPPVVKRPISTGPPVGLWWPGSSCLVFIQLKAFLHHKSKRYCSYRKLSKIQYQSTCFVVTLDPIVETTGPGTHIPGIP